MAKMKWGFSESEPDDTAFPEEVPDEPSSVEEPTEPEPAAPVKPVQDDTVLVELDGKRKRVSAAMASFLVSRRGAKRIG